MYISYLPFPYDKQSESRNTAEKIKDLFEKHCREKKVGNK